MPVRVSSSCLGRNQVRPIQRACQRLRKKNKRRTHRLVLFFGSTGTCLFYCSVRLQTLMVAVSPKKHPHFRSIHASGFTARVSPEFDGAGPHQPLFGLEKLDRFSAPRGRVERGARSGPGYGLGPSSKSWGSLFPFFFAVRFLIRSASPSRNGQGREASRCVDRRRRRGIRPI